MVGGAAFAAEEAPASDAGELRTVLLIGELGDNDNNHLLCLDPVAPAVWVAFPAGHLVDPNQDLNPDTRVAVTSAPRALAPETP